MNHQSPFFGAELAIELLVDDSTSQLRCAGCAERKSWVELRYAVAYGQPVALCGTDCYAELMQRWAPKAARKGLIQWLIG